MLMKARKLAKVVIGQRMGFTGTQIGMSSRQRGMFFDLLSSHRPRELHHGDCVGADKEAHLITRRAENSNIFTTVVGHPPINSAKRAFCNFDLELPPKEYLDRDQDIVDACDFLVAAPKSEQEELRSGTWTTVRYAREAGKPVIILPR